MTASIRLCTCAAMLLVAPGSPPMLAATLEARTIAAFDQYVAESDRQSKPSLSDPATFLWVDGQSRAADLAALRRGQLVISRLETKASSKEIEIPGGLVHHWIGVVFVPDVTVERAVSLLQDYNRHADVYKPAVAKSKLLQQTGEVFKMSLRFYMKKVITVVVNSDHEARFTRPAPDRAYSRIVSTRIAEVEDPDTPGEKEKPVGNDGGYLWRLNSNWRFLERDGGTYIQCESITLTRGLPFLIGHLIRPFVTSIPKESLTFTLEATRRELKGLN